MPTTGDTPKGNYRNHETPQTIGAELGTELLPPEYIQAIRSVLPPDRRQPRVGATYRPPPRENLPTPLLPAINQTNVIIASSLWENEAVLQLIMAYYGNNNLKLLLNKQQELDPQDPAYLNTEQFPLWVIRAATGKYKYNWYSHISPPDVLFYLWYGMNLQFTPEFHDLLYNTPLEDRNKVSTSPDASPTSLRNMILQYALIRIKHNFIHTGVLLHRLGLGPFSIL